MKTAVITGAGSGLGRAVSIRLAQDGFQLALLGRRRAALEDTADQIAAIDRSSSGATSAPSSTLVIPTDVSDATAVSAAFAATEAAFKRVDVLFNNAGTFAVGTPFEDIAVDDWRRVVDVNLTGAFLCAQAAVRIMKRQSPIGGRIINNGSVSAHVPRPMSAPYTATKHAMTGLTKSLSLDGRAHQIACSQIDIGNAATDFTARMADGILQADGSTKSEPRMNSIHVADAVSYIANLPLDANVQFMTVMATAMPYIGRG